MTMVETIIAGLALASITSITVIAYRHPKAYGRLFYWLNGAVMVGLCIAGAWDISNGVAKIAVLKAAATDELNAVSSIFLAAINEYNLPDWYIVVVVIVLLYFALLKALPLLLSDDDDEKKGHPEHE